MNAHRKYTDLEINEVIDILRERGGVITFPKEAAKLMSVKEFRVAHTTHPAATLSLLLRLPECPAFFARRGETGRIIEMRPTPELIAWLAEYEGPVRGVGAEGGCDGVVEGGNGGEGGPR